MIAEKEGRGGKAAKSSRRRTILVAESDIYTANAICNILQYNHYLPITAGDGEQMKHMMTDYKPELLLLGAELPRGGGIEAIERIRCRDGLPIIVISECKEEDFIIKALDAGADDYMPKPVAMGELIARIRVQLRHADKLADPEHNIVKVKDLVIDLAKRRVRVAGNDVRLTGREYRIVSILARNVGKISTYETLINEIWGTDAEDNNRILRVNMTNIRRKLGEDAAHPKYIATESGVGFRMLED